MVRVALTMLLAAVAAATGLALAGSSQGQSLTKVTLQSKWVVQAQFAGYYVAREKGYYRQAGLDVTIKPGGPDILPEQVSVADTAEGAFVSWNTNADAQPEAGVLLQDVFAADLRQSDFMFVSEPGFVAGIDDFGSHLIFPA